MHENDPLSRRWVRQHVAWPRLHEAPFGVIYGDGESEIHLCFDQPEGVHAWMIVFRQDRRLVEIKKVGGDVITIGDAVRFFRCTGVPLMGVPGNFAQ